MTSYWRTGFAITGSIGALILPAEIASAGPLDSTAPSPGTSPTYVSLKSASSKGVYGNKVSFSSRLSSFGKALKGRHINFYRQTDIGIWKLISRAKTGSSGKARFKAKHSSEASYAAAFSPTGEDLGEYSQSESNEIDLKVSPSIAMSVGKAVRGAIPGQRVRVRGKIKPSGLNAQIKVRVYRNGRKIYVRKVQLKNSRYKYSFKANRTGRYRVSASSKAAPGFVSGKSRTRIFRTVYPTLAPGSKGPAVSLLQRRLKRLHYWVSVTGLYDGATSRAVLAFRKVTGMTRTNDVNTAVWKKIGRGAGRFKLRHNRKGRYVEADLSRQVLVLASNGSVYRILHTSSGAPASPTVQGTFSVYSHTPGSNAKSMYYSVYFIRGYAIHGYPSVPPYPASHGCLRIPNENAVAVHNWLRSGDKITVYG